MRRCLSLCIAKGSECWSRRSQNTLKITTTATKNQTKINHLQQQQQQQQTVRKTSSYKSPIFYRPGSPFNFYNTSQIQNDRYNPTILNKTID